MAQLSPMMQQYMDIKAKHQDCILFFRLGDFYEMFFEDAITASKALELTLTGRASGGEERAPMAGVPYHSASGYIQKLIEQGYKVAICEQTSDPATSKGLVDREVVRIITPGTILEGNGLEEGSNHFLLSVMFYNKTAGLAFADVSTGEFFVYQIQPYDETLADEIGRIAPNEIITNDLERLNPHLAKEVMVTAAPKSYFQLKKAQDTLKKHFKVDFLSAIGLHEDSEVTQMAAGALMSYLEDTQKNALTHIGKIQWGMSKENLFLDRGARRNLELTQSINHQSRKGTLLELLDKTATAMGARMLKSMIEQPLGNIEQINRRLDGVEELYNNHVLCMRIGEELGHTYDIERLLSRVSYKSLNARDCLALGQTLKKIPFVKDMLKEVQSPLLKELYEKLNPMETLTALLEAAIHPDAPLVMTEGNIINDGFNETLDELRDAANHGKQWLLDLETKERQDTGIKNLRIQYNRVFGYYIEVTKSYYDLVPLRYQRKQTLANAERFITPELKEIEDKITGAQEQSIRLETALFAQVREVVAKEIGPMQETAYGLKYIDALVALAKAAQQYQYVRPQMVQNGEISIVNGRHPVVEQTIENGAFVPNDLQMDNEGRRMMIITGPNMAGKSTYMRQVALITLMAHMGSFIPAQEAVIPIVDRIFTRVGASDDLASGQSTFMVEMAEVANILRHATDKSLIILDEIGRGTSTFDGLAIAWAVTEYICNKNNIGGKTLFATHYHELSQLEGRLEGVINYCISVKERGEDIIFLRKIIPGGADKSFGVHVASLAGLPTEVLQRAREIQARLEVSDINQNTIGQNILQTQQKGEDKQVDLFHFAQTELIEEIKKLDVMAMTPMDAMNELFLLKEKARKL